MLLSFSCPSCGAAGTVDAAFAGRPGRCTHCNHRFTLPKPGATEDESYSLVEPVERRARPAPVGREPESAFVRARGEERTPSSMTGPSRKRAAPAAASRVRKARPARDSDFAWGLWLLRIGGVTLLALVAVALFAPDGPAIVGRVLLGLGSLLVLIGFAAGAYGAFCEDLLYGILYLALPFYTAYYLVTRWEDLWPWFSAATLGVGLVLLGTQILFWAGAIP